MTRRLLLSALSLGMLCSLTGCEFGRSFFQMSSDSPMPMFSFNLMPKRKARPSVTEISFEGGQSEVPIVTYQRKTKFSAIPVLTSFSADSDNKPEKLADKSSAISISLPFWKNNENSLLDKEGTALGN